MPDRRREWMPHRFLIRTYHMKWYCTSCGYLHRFNMKSRIIFIALALLALNGCACRQQVRNTDMPEPAAVASPAETVRSSELTQAPSLRVTEGPEATPGIASTAVPTAADTGSKPDTTTKPTQNVTERPTITPGVTAASTQGTDMPGPAAVASPVETVLLPDLTQAPTPRVTEGPKATPGVIPTASPAVANTGSKPDTTAKPTQNVTEGPMAPSGVTATPAQRTDPDGTGERTSQPGDTGSEETGWEPPIEEPIVSFSSPTPMETKKGSPTPSPSPAATAEPTSTPSPAATAEASSTPSPAVTGEPTPTPMEIVETPAKTEGPFSYEGELYDFPDE